MISESGMWSRAALALTPLILSSLGVFLFQHANQTPSAVRFQSPAQLSTGAAKKASRTGRTREGKKDGEGHSFFKILSLLGRVRREWNHSGEVLVCLSSFLSYVDGWREMCLD